MLQLVARVVSRVFHVNRFTEKGMEGQMLVGWVGGHALYTTEKLKFRVLEWSVRSFLLSIVVAGM